MILSVILHSAFCILHSAICPYNIPMESKSPHVPLTTTERIAWIILILSLLVGFGMTAFAPT